MRRSRAFDLLAAVLLIVVAWLVTSYDPPRPRAAQIETPVRTLAAMPALTPPPADPAPVPAATPAANYTGNLNTKKFHRITCRYAKCPNCKVKFATREEALAAGFDPCGVCDP
jgi:hypothetical protein